MKNAGQYPPGRLFTGLTEVKCVEYINIFPDEISALFQSHSSTATGLKSGQKAIN